MFFSWELIYPVGALILIAAMAYGYWQYKSRDRRNDRVAERVTRERYEDPRNIEKES